MRVILDTNIWISGLLLPRSKAGEVITAWRENKFNLVISQPILDELKKVLTYPKIKKRLKWDEDKINQYLSLLIFFAELTQVNLLSVKPNAVRDPNDIPILATLITSKADYLVTGDEDLLCLKQDYSIIPLMEFYELIR